MISSREMMSSLYGAYRLARADPSGMAYFNRTVDGFWRSFYAAALVAPLFALLLIIRFGQSQIEVSFLRFASVQSISYVIAWLTFPLLMFYIAEGIDRGEKFIGYIVVYNWASVIQNLAYLPFAIVAEMGVISAGNMAFFGAALLAMVMLYTWYITKTVLAITTMLAVGLVLLDFFISIFINLVTEGMIRPG